MRLALSRRMFAALAGAVTIGLACFASAPAEAAVNGSFKGDAFGVNATGVVGPIAVGLGKISYIPCPCRGTNNQLKSNTVNSLNVGNHLLTSGVVTGSVKAGKTSSDAKETTTGSVAGLNLFNGLVTAQGVKSVANVDATTSNITVDETGSTFVNLRISGQSVINGLPAPNTTIALPGIGQIVLNKRSVAPNGAADRRITVEMIVITVNTANSFGLPINAKIVIAHASAGFTRSDFPVFLGGEAYAALANAAIGRDLQTRIGKQADVFVPCDGTNNVVRSNNVASIDAGNALSLNSGHTTAVGGLTNDGPTAKTTSEIAFASLLKTTLVPLGIIRTTGLKAISQTTLKNGVRVRSTNGSTFGSIQIAGVSLPVTVPPNFTITALKPLLGITIKLNEQIVPAAASSDKLVVNMIKVTVNTHNALIDLPVGTVIIVGHANFGINTP